MTPKDRWELDLAVVYNTMVNVLRSYRMLNSVEHCLWLLGQRDGNVDSILGCHGIVYALE